METHPVLPQELWAQTPPEVQASMRGVMTLPQSGRLDGGEQPQGLPDARVPRLFKATVSIPAVDSELLLVAVLTAQGLFCPFHRGDRIPSRPEGCAVAMAIADLP